MSTDAPGSVNPEKLYIAADLRSHLRMGMPAWKRLIAAGMPTSRHGRHVYVLGADLIAAIRQPSTTEEVTQ